MRLDLAYAKIWHHDLDFNVSIRNREPKCKTKGYTMSRKTEAATMTADQAHALLGRDAISRGSFYSALKRGEIPHVRLGKRYLIPRLAFMRWLDKAEGRDAGAAA
jgi:excisionase family DNA binding protein